MSIHDSLIPTLIATVVLAALLPASHTTSSEDDQFAKAKQECAPQLAVMSPCLSYVGGDGITPTMDCCTATRQVLSTSKKCVCLLVKYKDEPGLGVNFDFNRVLGLPAKCHSKPVFTECPSLLHLSPNSTDAKMFEDYGKASENNTTSSSSSPTLSTSNATPASTSSYTKPNDGERRYPTTAVFYAFFIFLLFFILV